MKKLFGGLALSFWAAALAFSPAPASAVTKAGWGTCPSYMACSSYVGIYPFTACDGTYFIGSMRTVVLAACSGACSQTQGMVVNQSPGNGRKSREGGCAVCNGSYIYTIVACANCT